MNKYYVTITVDYDVLNRTLTRLKHRITALDGELMDIPVGTPRRASKPCLSGSHPTR